MAEFVQVMKDWRRMCKKNHTDCMRLCPICANPACGKLEDASNEDIRKVEDAIMVWAAEHPVVYPTWWEWLFSIGAVTHKVKPDVAATLIDTGLLDTIPADIAEKLGIELKEGV